MTVFVANRKRYSADAAVRDQLWRSLWHKQMALNGFRVLAWDMPVMAKA